MVLFAETGYRVFPLSPNRMYFIDIIWQIIKFYLFFSCHIQVVPAGSVPSQESGGSSPGESGGESGSEGKTYRSKEQLMLRANSLKKALRQIIEQAEKGKRKASPITARKDLLWSFFLLLVSLWHSGVFCMKFTGVIISVVDEQNRHTQVQRMSSLSSIKRENSEELKDTEPRRCPFSLTSAGTPGEGTSVFKKLSLLHFSEMVWKSHSFKDNSELHNFGVILSKEMLMNPILEGNSVTLYNNHYS